MEYALTRISGNNLMMVNFVNYCSRQELYA